MYSKSSFIFPKLVLCKISMFKSILFLFKSSINCSIVSSSIICIENKSESSFNGESSLIHSLDE